MKVKYQLLSTPLMLIATLIWNTAEKYNIDLGRFAPYVFGLMIGCRGKKIKEKNKE